MEPAAQPDPIKTMADLHKEVEDLASARGILRLTGEHLHERRVALLLGFRARLKVVVDSVQVHIARHRPFVPAQGGGHGLYQYRAGPNAGDIAAVSVVQRM